MKEKIEDENLNEVNTASTFKNILDEYKDNYKINYLINKSNISKIYKAENIKESRNVYLKVIPKKKLRNNYEYFIEQIKREEEILKLCESKNIIKLYNKIETEIHIIFELEYCGIDLSTYIKIEGPLKNKTELFINILKQISEALKILNKNGIIHRDIKPSNIYFDIFTNNIKLGGFGCSTYVKNNKFESIGSIFYAAPEIIKKLKYDEKCDLWSLGVTLYEIYFGVSPYGNNASLNLIKNIIYDEKCIYSNKASVPIFDELFKKLLTVNRDNRISYKDFYNFLNNIENTDIKLESIKEHSSIPNDFYEKNNKLNLKEKMKDNEIYLNSIKFECIDDKKNDIIIDEDEQTKMKKILNIIEEGKLPDLSDISIIKYDKKQKYNNIIYYDENVKCINYIIKDTRIFEKITPGAFILCTNIDSLNLIKTEILKNNLKNPYIKFNLMVTGSKCEKIMEYLEKNRAFDNCIKIVFVYCRHPENYQNLKEKYPRIQNNIYNTRDDIINFINITSSEDIKPFPLTKLITYEEYVDEYKKSHLKISKFYGDLSPKTYEKQIKDMKNLINKEKINNELKQSKNGLINGFLSFDVKECSKSKNIFSLDSDSDEDDDDISFYINEKIIQEYSGKYIYKDLNKWLLTPKKSYTNKDYETVAYFTARLIFELNSYALKNGKYFNQNKAVLFRGIKIPYSCLLQYERAERKIIVLTSFTSTSLNKLKALHFSGRNNSKEIYEANLLFSVLFQIENKWENDQVSNGIDIQDIAKYKDEKEILFLPFSFYYVKKVDINISKYTADIDLEIIRKSDIFEISLTEGKEIFYDGTTNSMKLKNKNNQDN